MRALPPAERQAIHANNATKPQKNSDNNCQWLIEHLEVKNQDESEIISISLSLREASQAVSVVNAIVDAYMQEVAEGDRRKPTQKLEVLRAAYRNKIAKLQEVTSDNNNKLAQELGVPESPVVKIDNELKLQQAKLLDQRISGMEQELLNDEIASQIATGTVDGAFDLSLRAQVLEKKLLELQQQREAMVADLRSLFGFSTQLETKKLEQKSLEKELTQLADEIFRLELGTMEPSRVQLVQRAVVANAKN